MEPRYCCTADSDCPLRQPRPQTCIPCGGPRNPACFRDKQPKIIGSLLGYFCINREPKNDVCDANFSCESNCNKTDASDEGDGDVYKNWFGRHIYNPCRERRVYHLRFTSSGVHGRGFNNTYRACSKCECGGCCGCESCDLYTPCLNDKY